MRTNAAGIALIKGFETLQLEAYPDPGTGGAPWTIGYGHTGPEVQPGQVITEAEADALLRADLGAAEQAVADALDGAPVTDDQFAALVSLAFNIGGAALASSTLLRKLQAGDVDGAAEEFERWNHAGGRVLAGLTSRRRAERALFEGSAA